ncbi:MAG: hypothetical protein IJK87_03885 [Prevotella sp.]|nr:hypothetical protein [Prevotella sp.]
MGIFFLLGEGVHRGSHASVNTVSVRLPRLTYSLLSVQETIIVNANITDMIPTILLMFFYLQAK